MSLREIVRALGGELYDGGRRANVPAPGHSAADRSVSLLLRDGRVVAHGFGGADWRAVLDDLRARGLIDAAAALSGAGGAARADRGPAARSARTRRAMALILWDGGRPLAGALSERHCRLRGVAGPLPGPEALRHHPAAGVSVYRDRGLRRPALVAAVRDAGGALTAVEVTYLAADGQRATDLRLPRKTVGLAPAGCAVRLFPAAERMLVAEGVFTALSAGARFGLPAWALMSAGNLRAWRPPPGVNAVCVAADRGAAGEAAAATLTARLRALGVAAEAVLPPPPFGDWNEWACAGRAP